MEQGKLEQKMEDVMPAPPDFRELLLSNPALELLLSLGPNVSWVLDVRTGQFDFLSTNVTVLLGYAPRQLLAGGRAFAERLFHPADLPWLQVLLGRTQAYLRALPPRRRLYHRVSFDARVRKADGAYVRLLIQHTVLQTDGQGAITHMLGTATDLSPWKRREALVATLQPPTGEAGRQLSSLDEACQPQPELSRREREIVRLLAQGLSSRQIAHRLCISFHTVNTHRRNMIGKTGTKSTGGLVQFAAGRGVV